MHAIMPLGALALGGNRLVNRGNGGVLGHRNFLAANDANGAKTSVLFASFAAKIYACFAFRIAALIAGKTACKSPTMP